MANIVILRSMNNFAYRMLRNMLVGLSDEQVSYIAPAIDERPIAGIVAHAYSGAYLMSFAVAGKERPERPTPPSTAADLLALLDSIHEQVDQNLANATDEALAKTYKMPWGQEVGGLEALTGAFAHSIVHAGAIQGIRAMGGFPTPPERY